jgi:alpha-beta hydrolase superfamily lysophospholipase
LAVFYAPNRAAMSISDRRARVLARVLFYGAAIFLGVPLALSQSMVRSHHLPTHPPPPGFEEARVVSEGLKLRTWTIAGDPRRAAFVVVHGVGDSLESYTDLADRLHRRGHTVLLVDLRGHGGSEGDTTTLGAREREDVRAGMRLLRERGRAAAGLALMGFSMGSVAVLRAAAVEPDVRVVVVEAPYDTLRDTVAQHAQLYYHLPRWTPFIPIVIRIAEWRGGYAAEDADAIAAARLVRAPLLTIADGADQRMPEAVVRRVYDAHPGPKQLWVAAGADHVGASLDPGYWPVLFGFLDRHGV